MRPHPSRLSCLLLGHDERAWPYVSQTLLSLGVYLLFAGVQLAAVSLGLLTWDDDLPLLAFTLLSSFCFYLLVRGGWGARLAADPSLAMPQMLAAIFSVAWAYAITGATGGSVVSIMTVVILFGMFGLQPRQTSVVAVLAAVALAAVGLYRALLGVPGFDWRVEMMQLLLGVIVLAAISILASRWQAMRQRLREQRADLARALCRIEALATRDTLTGLLNRRAMLEVLQREARIAERGESGPLVLALLDLDHFKRINDSRGHSAGDSVLRAFADLACAELRAADVLARWGGEEFLLLLPGTAPDEAAACLQRIRSRLAEWRLAEGGVAGAAGFENPGSAARLRPGQASLTVTFSAGLARCAGVHDLDAAIDRADHAMYRAKTAGRDRLVIDLAPGPTVTAANDAAAAPAAGPSSSCG